MGLLRCKRVGGSKWTVQKGESGRSRESGRSVQKWTVLSQTGRSFEPKWTVQDDSGRSFEPKWTVMCQRSRSFDSKWAVLLDQSKCQSGRSESVKLDGQKVSNISRSETVQKYFELSVHTHLNCTLSLCALTPTPIVP